MASQAQAKKAIAEHRMKRHEVICFFGAALIMWTVCQCSPTAAQVGVRYLTFAFLSVLLGFIAALFPSTAPCAKAVAWNGSLQTFLFVIILFHLRMIELYGVLGGSRTA
ncbi:unnamed protein product [Urochloa humidicola]